MKSIVMQIWDEDMHQCPKSHSTFWRFQLFPNSWKWEL